MLTSIRQMAKQLRAGILIVLNGYFDASGSDPNQDIVAVAGWGATAGEWDRWERQWVAMLAELGLERWHHTHFLSKRGEYRNWPEAKFPLAERQLIKIFNEIRLVGMGAAVWRADYQEALASGRWKLMPPESYAFCLNECLEGMIQRFHEAPKDEGVSIYVDMDSPAYKPIGEALTKWQILQSRDIAIKGAHDCLVRKSQS